VGQPSGKRSDSDPWTVPPSVRDRFIQEGNRFYFPDGFEAFRDRGRTLTTASANTEVIATLVDIARSRSWTEVSVAGTEAFRRESWRQARLAGIEVRGYRPTDEERVALIRAIGSRREAAREPATESAIPAILEAAPPARSASTLDREQVRGRLLEHGQDFYRHDASKAVSYFVKLETPEGTREVWGKDIERALKQSLSKPRIGDEVVLQRTGRDAVTVRRQGPSEDGEVGERSLAAFRNRWTLETRKFMEERGEAAHAVRDVAVKPQDAVRTHPELVGTYLNLRKAQLAARILPDADNRREFVRRVRLALARDVERGEPLPQVRLRERGSRTPLREKHREELAPQR
jgi:hypothetical protein